MPKARRALPLNHDFNIPWEVLAPEAQQRLHEMIRDFVTAEAVYERARSARDRAEQAVQRHIDMLIAVGVIRTGEI